MEKTPHRILLFRLYKQTCCAFSDYTKGYRFLNSFNIFLTCVFGLRPDLHEYGFIFKTAMMKMIQSARSARMPFRSPGCHAVEISSVLPTIRKHTLYTCSADSQSSRAHIAGPRPSIGLIAGPLLQLDYMASLVPTCRPLNIQPVSFCSNTLYRLAYSYIESHGAPDSLETLPCRTIFPQTSSRLSLLTASRS